MRKIIYLSIGFSVLLSASVSPEEYKRQQASIVEQEATQDDQQCRSYGAERKSVAYFNCRQNLFALREAKKKFQQQQASEAYSELGRMGSQMLSQPQHTGMNCTTTKQGIFLNTNCF